MRRCAVLSSFLLSLLLRLCQPSRTVNLPLPAESISQSAWAQAVLQRHELFPVVPLQPLVPSFLPARYTILIQGIEVSLHGIVKGNIGDHEVALRHAGTAHRTNRVIGLRVYIGKEPEVIFDN